MTGCFQEVVSVDLPTYLLVLKILILLKEEIVFVIKWVDRWPRPTDGLPSGTLVKSLWWIGRTDRCRQRRTKWKRESSSGWLFSTWKQCSNLTCKSCNTSHEWRAVNDLRGDNTRRKSWEEINEQEREREKREISGKSFKFYLWN